MGEASTAMLVLMTHVGIPSIPNASVLPIFLTIRVTLPELAKAKLNSFDWCGQVEGGGGSALAMPVLIASTSST
jgi:hypothetical protein